MKNALTLPLILIVLCRAAVVAGCTSWVITPERSASGRMLLHKSRDQHISPLAAVMRENDGVRWMSIGTTAGATFGLSERGVAATSNAGDTPIRPPQKTPKRSGNIFRAIAVNAGNAAEAAEFVRKCGRDGWRPKGGLYLVADAKRAFTIEIAPGYGEIMEIPGWTYVISNSMHLGGGEGFVFCPADKLCSHREREAKTRAELRKNRIGGKYPVAGVFRASRLTGKATPFNRFSLSAVCFELDGEFPAQLGCAYIALGPQQHTVYLPTPMALRQFPEDMQNGKWAAHAFALREKIGDDHRYLPRIEALERELVAEFSAVRAEALNLLRSGRRAEAEKLLNDTFMRHYGKAKELLRRIAEDAGVDPDPPVPTRQDEARRLKAFAQHAADREKNAGTPR